MKFFDSGAIGSARQPLNSASLWLNHATMRKLLSYNSKYAVIQQIGPLECTLLGFKYVTLLHIGNRKESDIDVPIRDWS